ncbi:hypothetical protein LTS18_014756, partial [Coniosporium uncinatum]
MREPSKDWKWKGHAEDVAGQNKKSQDKKSRGPGRRKSMRKKRDKGAPGPNVRPFAWLDIKVQSDSTINYVMDMYARPNGFGADLDVDVRGVEIQTSVNHGLLWRSKGVSVEGNLSYPLQWNALRKWPFKISVDDLDLFILRDHFFLIIDLVGDWGSGPPSDFFLFTPFKYLLNLEFRNFKLYLNTNDSNIINNPSDLDDNTFVILGGRSLIGSLEIPIDRYRPVQNEIKFDILGSDFYFEMSMPTRNTLDTYLRTPVVAQLDEVTLKGSHTQYTETSISLTDTLFFDIHGKKLVLNAHGFVLRHLINIKENYFGEFIHFKTLEEFQELQHSAVDGEIEEERDPNRANDLD